MPVNAGTLLVLAGKAFEMWAEARAAAKAAGITDEQLDALALDYDARIARREAEAQPPAEG